MTYGQTPTIKAINNYLNSQGIPSKTWMQARKTHNNDPTFIEIAKPDKHLINIEHNTPKSQIILTVIVPTTKYTTKTWNTANPNLLQELLSTIQQII